MDEQANIEFVKQCYDAYIKGDGQRLMSYMDPDIDWEVPEVPGIAFSGKRHGVAQVAEFFQMVADTQQLRTFHPEEFFANGDRVVALGHYDWTVKANNCDFGTDFVHIFTVRDGKVTSFREALDTQAVISAYQRPAAGAMAPQDAARPSVH